MTIRQMMQLVLAWGVVSVVAHLLGLDDVAGILSFIHLGGLIGAPLAMVLNRHLRSTSATIALAVALSFALSALAVQSLIWFSLATRVSLLVVATAYGLGLASLLVPSETRTAEATRP